MHRLHGLHRLLVSSVCFTALATIGCLQHDPEAPPPPAVEPEDADAGAPDGAMPPPACRADEPPIDVLVVMDDSGSMCEEQRALGAAFPALDAALAGRDWRLAVTSTDMNPDNDRMGAFGLRPALPVPSLNCIDDDGMPDVPDTADCFEVLGPDFGGPVLDATALDAETRAIRYRCMTTLGTQGDGFEKPLAASASALSCDGPNADLLGPCGGADPQFLRPGAALVVIYIGDEDDCSDALRDPDDPARRIDCEDVEGPCPLPRRQSSACVWFADELDPVEHYAAVLRAANPGAPAVTVLAVSGAPFAPIDGQSVRFVPGERDDACIDDDGEAIIDAACCPDGRCEGEIAPSCAGDHGWAFAGDRLRALEALFPGECVGDGCGSICRADTFDDLGQRLLDKLDAALPPRCDG